MLAPLFESEAKRPSSVRQQFFHREEDPSSLEHDFCMRYLLTPAVKNPNPQPPHFASMYSTKIRSANNLTTEAEPPACKKTRLKINANFSVLKSPSRPHRTRTPSTPSCSLKRPSGYFISPSQARQQNRPCYQPAYANITVHFTILLMIDSPRGHKMEHAQRADSCRMHKIRQAIAWMQRLPSSPRPSIPTLSPSYC